MSERLPRANSAPVDPRNGAFTSEWYSFFQTLIGGEISAELQAEIDALAARVAQLEADETADFIIQGVGSVSVYGTPQSGVVQVTLQGDLSSPGAGYFYGTDAAGVKGWFQVPAEFVTYDNTASGLAAENVQAAIDELAAMPNGVGVPYEVADGTFYAVPAGIQALFSIPIDLLGASYLDLSGALVEVN